MEKGKKATSLFTGFDGVSVVCGKVTQMGCGAREENCGEGRVVTEHGKNAKNLPSTGLESVRWLEKLRGREPGGKKGASAQKK